MTNEEKESRAWAKALTEVEPEYCLKHGWQSQTRCTICLDNVYKKELKRLGWKNPQL